MKINHLINFID